jgi:hypothetical protein
MMSAGDLELERLTQSAEAVAGAGRRLRAALDDPVEKVEAADRLAATIEHGLAALARAEASAFEADGATADTAAEPPEVVLGIVAGKLRIGEVALAAGTAVDERTPDSDRGFDDALAALRMTANALDRPDGSQEWGFAAERRTSADLPTASAAFQQAAAETLDSITARAAKALSGPLRTLASLSPDAARRAWEQAKARLPLDSLGGRLVQLGVRALASALEALHRLIKAEWLETARRKLMELSDRVVAQGAVPAALGWVLGIAAVSAEATAVAGRPGMEIDRLDAGSDALQALAGRFGDTMDMVGLAQSAVAGIGAIKLVGLAVPHLAAVIMGAELLLGAVVVVLALDYVDSTPVAGWVQGARVIIRKAAAVP